MTETDVLIIGAGPVGSMLAGELGWRGVNCKILEERIEPTAHPKATLLGSRSMEFFRRWGITEQIYDSALPRDNRYFITFSNRLAGHELYRLSSPSIAETIARTPDVVARFRELTWSPYYKTQIGQQALEPILWKHIQTLQPVQLMLGWRFEQFQQDMDGVTVRVTEVATGLEKVFRTRYLVACDGGTSQIRKQLGIRFVGRGAMRANVSFYFESSDFLQVHGKGLGNLYFVFSPDSFGVFTAVNGRDLWSYQYYFLDRNRVTRDLDPEEILYRAVGKPFRFTLKGTQHWHHHQSVATTWRAGLDPCDSAGGRVFLAGDSAHLFAPTGGVGMNTGIGDAVDLGWKLAQVLDGTGGETLLASYEIERKPIAVRNSVISANNSDKIDMVMAETPVEIDEDSPLGVAARTAVASKIRWMSRQFNSAGTHLGYRYVDSPVIETQGDPEPPDDPAQVVPSTWPGCRAPHAWLKQGTDNRGPSTLDWFGYAWTLVCAEQNRTKPFQNTLLESFRRVGVPLSLQHIEFQDIRQLYEKTWVLVRPDGHVAWRGDQLPENSDLLVKKVLGRS